MYDRSESEYFTAKRKAARQLGLENRTRPGDLPSNAEIRDQIQSLANLYEGDSRTHNLRAMRLEALRLMRLLSPFRPHLIGSTLTGHTRRGSDIDLHLFSDHPSAVTTLLDDENLPHTLERKRILKHNQERIFTHIHLQTRFHIELTLYDTSKINYPFKSSITGKLIERASIAELEALLKSEDPDIDLDTAPDEDRFTDTFDRFDLYKTLLEPLEHVKQKPLYHPEGDALYHSLQAFELAREQVSYDEDFITAALLHDVGKAIDPHDHTAAALDALQGSITDRIEFLIRHHMDAHAIHTRTLGHRAHQRLQSSEHYSDLLLLGEIDRSARTPGIQVCTLPQALSYLRSLDTEE
jgi:predicted HD phosphohydrolase